MQKYIINFDELSVSYIRTKAQVAVSEEDYQKIKNGSLELEDVIDNYEPEYGEPNEEDYEVEELQVVHTFEMEVA